MIRYDKQDRRESKLRGEVASLEERLRTFSDDSVRIRSILYGLLHEMRRLNAEISTFCEELGKAAAEGSVERASELSESINYASGLVSSRLVFTDFELNPQSLGRQAKMSMGVYRKFDKARRLLYKSARAKHLRITLVGTSYIEVEAIPAFELVPFVILDNAIKYSPAKQDIAVEFEENPTQRCRARVRVTSVGPQVGVDELPLILQRGVRGRNADRGRIPGDGLGLFLVETLAKSANARLSVSSSPDSQFSLEDVPYSEFQATIEFYR